MLDKKPNRVGIAIAISASVLIFVAAIWLFFNRQYAIDQVSVWAYTPSAEIENIENRLDLTSKGSFYFHASHPEVASAQSFNQVCPRQEPGSPILGCYSEGQIYIYNVTNEKLDGIEEVTAAHEMLHAAWDRLSSGEQQRIGNLLRNEYVNQKDADFKKRMDYYARTEPGQLENELHSIIGTEFANISSELEAYYAQYFSDRSKVLTLHKQYNSIFETLSQKSQELYEYLVDQGNSIEQRTIAYNSSASRLSTDIRSFNSRANTGGFTSITQFNEERAVLVERSQQLEADRAKIDRDISTYKKKFKEYQDLALQIEQLNNSIDSIRELQPAPSL